MMQKLISTLLNHLSLELDVIIGLWFYGNRMLWMALFALIGWASLWYLIGYTLGYWHILQLSLLFQPR